MATGNPLSLNVQCLLIMYNFMISYDQLTRTKLAQSLQVSCPHFDFLFLFIFFPLADHNSDVFFFFSPLCTLSEKWGGS